MTGPIVPQFGSLHRLTKDGWEGAPDGPSPFYIGASDGLFVHKRMLIGRGVARIEHWPTTLPKFGNPTGSFDFQADPIPAQMMGQIVNFFERIYDKQHTEAAVLLVMHAETKQWRIFIPTQLLSHGGVNYVFDPADIKYPWVLVGSIHSHCDFGAGHSSTDTNDADGFDGIHCTIGHIKDTVPQIVAMVAMNKKLFHYEPVQFPYLFDYSEPKGKHEAPAWWDRYCEDTVNKIKPVGFELYEKFNRPTVIKPEKAPTTITRMGWPPIHQYPQQRNGYTPQVGAWNWDNNRRLMVRSPSMEVIKGIGVRPLGADTDDWDNFYQLQGMDGPPEGYGGYHPETLMKRGYIWDQTVKTWVWTSGHSAHGSDILKESKNFNTRSEELQRWLDEDEKEWTSPHKEQSDLFWEDVAGKELTDILFDSLLVNDEDIDFAIGNPGIAGDPEYWKDNILGKIYSGISVLQALGMNIGLTLEPHTDVKMALLPERTTLPPNMEGAH